MCTVPSAREQTLPFDVGGATLSPRVLEIPMCRNPIGLGQRAQGIVVRGLCDAGADPGR